jgi:hypothetical protein
VAIILTQNNANKKKYRTAACKVPTNLPANLQRISPAMRKVVA